MTDVIRIAAVDDHALFLEGLRRALSFAPDMAVVAEGATAADACRIAAEHTPDVLILDLRIPGHGITAARAIASLAPSVKIMIVTGSSEEDQVAAAVAAGAKGYVLKGAGAAEVQDAVRAVHTGRPYVTPELASRLLLQLIARAPTAGEKPACSKLHEREQQILEFARAGLTNKEIAARLGRSVRSVRKCMSSILRKCGARNRLEAAVALGGTAAKPDSTD